MDYFELYDIPVSFFPDKDLVKQKFYELSRKFHPDFYGSGTDDEQAEALEMSSLNNKAYNILRDSDALIKYVLKQKELLEEEEKYNLPQMFLMEMLDINDEADDAKHSNDAYLREKIKSKIDRILQEIYEPVKQIIENYKEGITTTEELLQVKEYYFKKKYLTRILEGLQ